MKLGKGFILLLLFVYSLSSCKITGQIKKDAAKFLSDSLFLPTHPGISIYDPENKKFLYNHEAEKYFLPASNTKLFTLYAGLKYLSDSLPSARFTYIDSTLVIFPTGDPSFLHPDFKQHPLFDLLKKSPSVIIATNSWQTNALGYGWAWDDYNDYYMVERSILPVYGNIVSVGWNNDSLTFSPYKHFNISTSSLIPDSNILKYQGRTKNKLPEKFTIKRVISTNRFEIEPGTQKFTGQEIPIQMSDSMAMVLLNDTLRQFNPHIKLSHQVIKAQNEPLQLIRSQPSDSLFRLMMHRSDNFFAEQTLLMAANEKLHLFNEHKFIDTLLKTDLRDIPQKPQWVDGSGLSRYNLFTPKSFIYILDKMKSEFGLSRLKGILATGGQGTLRSYYLKDSGFIYAKTGTISNNLALSGFIITNRQKLLIFSIMVNGYPGGATPIRRKIESFLSLLRKKY